MEPVGAMAIAVGWKVAEQGGPRIEAIAGRKDVHRLPTGLEAAEEPGVQVMGTRRAPQAM